MNVDIGIINGLVNFLAVSLIFLVVLYLSLLFFLKNFKFDKKNIELYGMFLHLNVPSLIAISALTINYLFLVWATVSFDGLNIIYISFTLILMLLSDIVTDNFKLLFRDVGVTIFNCLAIELVYLIYNYLVNVYSSILLLVVLVLVIIFIFLYYTYNLFREINNIVIDNKHMKRRNYKV